MTESWMSGEEWLAQQTAQELQELAASDLSSMSGELVKHHAEGTCSGRCPIHAPSDHSMVTWKLRWREDRRIMMRVCEHNVDHPDPDDLKVRFRVNHSIHWCDGCCGNPLGIQMDL